MTNVPLPTAADLECDLTEDYRFLSGSGSTLSYGATMSLLRRCIAAEALVRRLRAAAQYAAGSFAQVPAEQTVPPIVLHDCREKLEEALTPPATSEEQP